jgi:hypothetical protein
MAENMDFRIIFVFLGVFLPIRRCFTARRTPGGRFCHADAPA